MEKRRERRSNKNLLVYLKEDSPENVELLGVTANISKNGFFVESMKTFPPSSEITIVLAIDKELFHIKGEVVWNKVASDDKQEQLTIGMGIKIIEAPEEYWNFMEYMRVSDSGTFNKAL